MVSNFANASIERAYTWDSIEITSMEGKYPITVKVESNDGALSSFSFNRGDKLMLLPISELQDIQAPNFKTLFVTRGAGLETPNCKTHTNIGFSSNEKNVKSSIVNFIFCDGFYHGRTRKIKMKSETDKTYYYKKLLGKKEKLLMSY